MTEARDFVCDVPTTVAISNINSYVTPHAVLNPISQFNATKLDIIRAGSKLDPPENGIVGRLLIVGAVSAFENYCRGILSGCLILCPISQARSSEKNVTLGGAIWHGPSGNFNRSAFEHKSFADTKELKNAFREFVGFEMGSSVFSDLLTAFEVVMQLRHAIVHADGILPGRNAVKLEILRSSPELKITISEARLQECLLVLTSLVLAINRELFETMCRRWSVEWRLRSDWQPQSTSRLLSSIFSLFVDRAYNQSLKNRRLWRTRSLEQLLSFKYNIS